uniref:Uncharacterized protein LOC116288091 n=1 Tax=Actinia tenebrosa TaxID=6105 RepID=A0A6P8H5E7_ACTTE
MDCNLFVLLIFGLSVYCTEARYHGKRDHTAHTAHSKQPKKKQLSQSKTTHEHYHSALHKKEEMLGQDSMRINEEEFKLQSLVSPEFHQGSRALKQGKAFGNMEVNTLSPEQVDFMQSTSQWPKFYDPAKGKTLSRTIYPEDPVLFPQERQNTNTNYNGNSNWMIGNDGFKQAMSPYSDATSISSMLSMPTGSSSLGNGNEVFQRSQDKSNDMMFEERPRYKMNDKMPISDFEFNDDINKMSMNAKNMMGFGGPSKYTISSFLGGGGLVKGHGKPIGILGNILKASQAMPTGRIVKPSSRSQTNWFNDGPFSRRQNLERSMYIAPAAAKPESTSYKHTIKHISKVNQKTMKKSLSKKSKL